MIDTGTGAPPDERITLDMALIGYVLGHPLHLGLIHRLSTSGRLTGHARLATTQIGAREALDGPVTPWQRSRCRVEFFNKIVLGLRQKPHLERLVLVTVGLMFESHRGPMDIKFINAWIALESLVNGLLELGELVAEKPRVLADIAQWRLWAKSRKDEIMAHAIPGNEAALFDSVISLRMQKPMRVRDGFVQMGIPWTSEMDVLAEKRSTVAHEGALVAADQVEDRAQICLMHTMQAVVLAKIFGYHGPVRDYQHVLKEPTWWPSSAVAESGEFVIRVRSEGTARWAPIVVLALLVALALLAFVLVWVRGGDPLRLGLALRAALR